jgi:hypothetical protein
MRLAHANVYMRAISVSSVKPAPPCELRAFIDDEAFRLRRKELCFGREFRAQTSHELVERAMVGGSLSHIETGPHLGHLEARVLKSFRHGAGDKLS